jgi:hypothetical protein
LKARIARTAPREELDAAREPTERIIRESGFDPSPFVVASAIPGAIRWYRDWRGEQWWRTRAAVVGPAPPVNRQQRRQDRRSSK